MIGFSNRYKFQFYSYTKAVKLTIALLQRDSSSHCRRWHLSLKKGNGLIRNNVSYKFSKGEDSIKRWKSIYLSKAKELEEASGYFLSRHPSEPRHAADTAHGHSAKMPFLQNPLSTPTELSRPAFRFTIPAGFSGNTRRILIFRHGRTDAAAAATRLGFAEKSTRRHPRVLYRYSLHTYRYRARDFEANVLNALAGPQAQTRHLYFAEEDHTFICTVPCLRKGIYFDFRSGRLNLILIPSLHLS